MLANNLINELVDYVSEIKPFHTKIVEVSVSLVDAETSSVSLTEHTDHTMVDAEPHPPWLITSYYKPIVTERGEHLIGI